MKITFDAAKRDLTLEHRGLDFADAAKVFAGLHATQEADRQRYPEIRYISAGYLNERSVVVVWTPRDEARHIISMRHGHAKEEKRWIESLARSR